MASTAILMCVECEDVYATLKCLDCDDVYCGLCFSWQHKKGNRAKHRTVEVQTQLIQTTTEALQSPASSSQTTTSSSPTTAQESSLHTEKDVDISITPVNFSNIAQFIPLRVTPPERILLQILEGALDISEYTDKVDTSHDYFGWRVGNKTEVMKKELRELFSLLSGLLVSNNFRSGRSALKEKSFEDNAKLFQKVFEIGRRFKILNPDKMRTTYGKLMYLLQDSQQPDVLDFNCVIPIKTVHSFLEKRHALHLLDDDDLSLAALEVSRYAKTREEVAALVQEKKEARQRLIEDHESEILVKEDIELVIDSISDGNSFYEANCTPIERMIDFLGQFKSEGGSEYALDIKYGYGGSKLSHSHNSQFNFVLQSLQLWKHIQIQMFRLWILTDEDLLNPSNPYRLCNTGQGLMRLQSAPRVSHAMHEVVRNVQQEIGSWVGLSVVHLGDRDVPNALVFIDKYTQVPRILGPIFRTIESLPRLIEGDKELQEVFDDTCGGIDKLRKTILRDFFRHGFDGSGDDGGSCIDGRLTSAWNWCSKLEKKSFYRIFMLAGFEGFDGSFKK